MRKHLTTTNAAIIKRHLLDEARKKVGLGVACVTCGKEATDGIDSRGIPRPTCDDCNGVSEAALEEGRKRLQWNMFGGGSFAKDGKHSLSVSTQHGSYHIQPVSSRHNVNRHAGYNVHFTDEKGHGHNENGGLWKHLNGGNLTDLNSAKRLANEHHQSAEASCKHKK